MMVFGDHMASARHLVTMLELPPATRYPLLQTTLTAAGYDVTDELRTALSMCNVGHWTANTALFRC